MKAGSRLKVNSHGAVMFLSSVMATVIQYSVAPLNSVMKELSNGCTDAKGRKPAEWRVY